MPKIKAVIFDLDDTLYDATSQLIDVARKRVAKKFVELGVPLSEQELIDLQVSIFNQYGGKADIFEHIIDQFDLPHKHTTKKEILKVYSEDTIPPIIPFPETIPLLKELKKNNIKIGIVTTGRYTRQMNIIDMIGIKKYIDEIVVHNVEEGGTKKDSFLHILSRLKIKPENVVSVGDKIYSEIKVSNILGMHTVQFVHGRFKDVKPKLPTEYPDFKVGLLSELIVIIKRIESGKKGRPTIVLIGGGSGTSLIIRGLKQYTPNLTAIVTVTDTGRTTGMIRKELGVAGTGDLRNCLIALSEDKGKMKELFDYRFEKGSMKGYSFGNLFLASLAKTTGSLKKALAETRKILKIKGQVLPVTLDQTHICVELEDGRIVEQEDNIVARHDPDVSKRSPVKRAFLKPGNVKALPEAVQAIKNADAIVFDPGCLFTSLISNLLVKDIKEAIVNSPAPKVYVCNIMTQQGQTDGYTASDHIKQIERYTAQGILDFAIFNTEIPEKKFLYAYEKEHAYLVKNDMDEIEKLSLKPVFADVLQARPQMDETDFGNAPRRDYLRHNPEKIGKVIMGLF
jgi:uncharacterized cofD-like protein